MGDFFELFSQSPILFSSEAFWLLTLLFLPAYGLLFRRKSMMVVFVLLFGFGLYYLSSGILLLVLLGRIFIDFFLSKLLSRSGSRRQRRAWLVIGLVFSVGTLIYFKYAGFLVADFNRIFQTNFQLIDMAVPLGISFYTFRSVCYLVEVYRRTISVPESILDYAFYLSFFPSFVAGPIARPGNFLLQIRQGKRLSYNDVFSGFWLVMVGLFKKAVIADYLAQYNGLVFSNVAGYSGLECLLAVAGYGIQIYFDFSGYSDMAIGLARSMGFDLEVNFRKPYQSANLSEFWRRWHISLSSWLRDYVYIPLGGNRSGAWRTSLNLLLTMLVGGVWHGAGWNFLIWGGMHGIGLVSQKFVLEKMPRVFSLRISRLLGGVVTFLFVNLLWVFFRAASFQDALLMLSRIFTAADFEIFPSFFMERQLWTIVLGTSFVLIFLPDKIMRQLEAKFVRARWFVKLLLFCVLVQVILEFKGETVSPFIYASF